MNTENIAIILMVILISTFAGVMTQTAMYAWEGKTQTTTGSASTPYQLTLLIANNVPFGNGNDTQPRYYVVTTNGLASSARITIPAHRLIKLTIINYDDGTADIPQQFLNVTGVLNETVTPTVGNTTAYQLTTIPQGQDSHTFTITSLGINIIVPPTSIVTAYLMFNQTGTFSWQCFNPCGSGPTGWGEAMSTPGWMNGQISVV
jgi:hypothetical protein